MVVVRATSGRLVVLDNLPSVSRRRTVACGKRFTARVAQVAEQQSDELPVVGSNPTPCTWADSPATRQVFGRAGSVKRLTTPRR